MAATVLYPGSFDPIHRGHLDVIAQSAELFDSVTVVVIHNPSKTSGTFTLDERVRLITASVEEAGLRGIEVATYGGLTVDAARELGSRFIVRGLRNAGDFEVEQQMALTNHAASGFRTVYLPCGSSTGFISSRFVREIALYGGDIHHLVPGPVAQALAQRFATAPASPDGASDHPRDNESDD